MFARKLGKGITLEMYIRNTQVNNKKKIKKKRNVIAHTLPPVPSAGLLLLTFQPQLRF